MKKFLKRATLVVALALPAVAWAQGANEGGTDERRRFWGQSESCTGCIMGSRSCTTSTYVFWIEVWSSTGDPISC